MKPFQKVIAGVMAILLIASVAVGCTPISMGKEWSYKYSDDVLKEDFDIGVYIYSLYSAYNQAKTYAEKVDGYSTDKSFMDLEITDDDGKKAKAETWIKEKAEKDTLNIMSVDYLYNKLGATSDEAAVEQSNTQLKTIWEQGPYASYGYYQPVKDEVEKFGVSYESFAVAAGRSYGSGEYVVKLDALFGKLYRKGGTEEVSDKELTEFFTKNYTNYSYIPVKLYEEKTGDDENTTSVKFSDSKIKKIKAQLETYAGDITSGTMTFADASKAAQDKYSVTESDVVTDKAEFTDSIKDSNEDISKALNKLDEGKAKLITVGEDGDSPMAYVVVKNDIKDAVKDNIKNDANRESVLAKYKTDDFNDYIEKNADEMKKSKSFSKNEGVINSYNPSMFFEPVEPTTATGESSDDSGDAE